MRLTRTAVRRCTRKVEPSTSFADEAEDEAGDDAPEPEELPVVDMGTYREARTLEDKERRSDSFGVTEERQDDRGHSVVKPRFAPLSFRDHLRFAKLRQREEAARRARAAERAKQIARSTPRRDVMTEFRHEKPAERGSRGQDPGSPSWPGSSGATTTRAAATSWVRWLFATSREAKWR
jgi:hypothetical protein